MKKNRKMKAQRNFSAKESSALKKLFRMARITAFFLFVGIVQVMAVDLYSQSARLSLNMNNKRLENVLEKIESESEFFFIYSKDQVNVEQKVDVNVENESISSILDKLLRGKDIAYTVYNRQIVLSNREVVSKMIAQQKVVVGVVTDEAGNPIPGVTVVIVGTTNGTITDVNGKYSLSNIPDGAVLRYSFIGMRTQEIVVGNQTTINVTMQMENIGLDEVVSIGYGSQKKANLTGSVSSVKFDKLSTRPAANTASLLQGEMAGVTVRSLSPAPGSEDVRITIRGLGSFNNNNPLVLIDGVEGNLALLSPSDIESVSVLKDAASASIYGVRAANGVILVTTKRGKTGAPTVSVQYNYGMQDRVLKLDLLDSPTWAETWNLIGEESGKGKDYYYYPDEIAKMRDGSDPDHWANTDWLKEVYRIAPMHKAYVSLSGGTKKVKYLISSQFLDQQGVIHEASNRQINTRANVDADVTDWFRAGLNMSFVNKHVNYTPVNQYDGVIHYKPTVPVRYSTTGKYGAADGSVFRNMNPAPNPDYSFDLNHNFSDGYTCTSRGYAEFDLAKNLTFKTTVSGTISFYRHELFISSWALYTPEDILLLKNDHNQAMNASGLDKAFQNENIFTYKFDLNENNKFKFLAGHSIKTYRHDDFSGSVKDFPNDEIYVLSAGVNDKDVTGYSVESSLQSFFGRLNYSLYDRYLLEANVRADGSSRFPKSSRYGVFPAFSGAWILSNESFMQNIGPVSVIKLRGSWGVLGNQEIGDYAFQSTLSTGADYTVGNVLMPGVSVSSLTNPNIGWETTTIANVGLDINFFKNKLALTVDAFNKTTKDILMRLPVPYTSGFEVGPLQNVGAVENKGFEVSLSFVDNVGEFNYSISGNISKIANKITDFGGLEPSISGHSINELGYPMNDFYGLIADGFFKDEADAQSQMQFGVYARPGDIKYKDISGPDGVPDGVIDTQYDRTHLGSPFPELTYSFNISFDWRGIDFSCFWQGVSDVTTFNSMNTDVLETNMNFTTRVLDVNTATYTDGSWPRWGNLANNLWNGWSSFWIEDGSYLRLKNLELGYTFPERIISDIGLKSVRLYFSGTNLLTFTKVVDFDPEKPTVDMRERSFPQTKVYSLGINLNF